jgi:uncharacterized protein
MDVTVDHDVGTLSRRDLRMAAMEHLRTWISMGDGVRLAARLWLPDEQPAAAVLEALPYRMDDLTSSYATEYARLC